MSSKKLWRTLKQWSGKLLSFLIIFDKNDIGTSFTMLQSKLNDAKIKSTRLEKLGV
jgi:hypothetical protein